MTLTKIDNIEAIGRRKGWHNLQKLIADFVASDMKCAEVTIEEGEYASVGSAYSCLWNACKISRTNVYVRKIENHVYLLKDKG